MTTTADDAARALAAVRTAREQLAVASEPTPARHLAYAAVMGVLVALPAVPNTALRSTLLALSMVAVVLIIQWDRRRNGVFVNSYRAGQTRPLTWAMLALFVVFFMVSTWCGLVRHLIWPSLVLGAATVPLACAGSVWWQRVFRREMEAGA